MIKISSSLSNEKKWSVLLHEWAHAVMYVIGASSVLSDEVEEILAQSFEHAIQELLLQQGNNIVTALHIGEGK